MDTPFPHEVFSLVAIVKCKSGLRVGLNQVNDENSKLSYLILRKKATEKIAGSMQVPAIPVPISRSMKNPDRASQSGVWHNGSGLT